MRSTIDFLLWLGGIAIIANFGWLIEHIGPAYTIVLVALLPTTYFIDRHTNKKECNCQCQGEDEEDE